MFDFVINETKSIFNTDCYKKTQKEQNKKDGIKNNLNLVQKVCTFLVTSIH